LFRLGKKSEKLAVKIFECLGTYEKGGQWTTADTACDCYNVAQDFDGTWKYGYYKCFMSKNQTTGACDGIVDVTETTNPSKKAPTDPPT
jgi:hypothetical protein